MMNSARRLLLATALLVFPVGCAVFEPAYPSSVSQSAAAGLTGVSELVAAAQLGDFRNPGSYKDASSDYAATLAQLELARSWVAARATSGDRLPAAKAAKLLADDLSTCASGVQEMAQQHRSAGLPATSAYSLVQTTCAVPINNILQ